MTRSLVKLSIVTMTATTLAAIAGCSGSGSSGSWTVNALSVQGTVTQDLAIGNGRAVATDEDGATIWAPLDSEQDFTLLLPVGHSYEIFVASVLSDGSEMKVGHLVLPEGSGTTTWLGANDTGTVDLGVLYPETTAALSVDWGTEGNHANDPHCHQGSTPPGGMCCDSHGDWTLRSTKSPGSRCANHWGHGGGQGGSCPPCPPQTDGGGGQDAATGGGGPGASCDPDGGAPCMPTLVCVSNTCVQPGTTQ